jgi:hypothetical protein
MTLNVFIVSMENGYVNEVCFTSGIPLNQISAFNVTWVVELVDPRKNKGRSGSDRLGLTSMNSFIESWGDKNAEVNFMLSIYGCREGDSN